MKKIFLLSLLFSWSLLFAFKVQGQVIAGGYFHSIAICSNNSVNTWGYNDYGQLGNGTTNNTIVPGANLITSDAIAVSAGKYQSLVLKSDGTVWSWGFNMGGELGNANKIQIPV